MLWLFLKTNLGIDNKSIWLVSHREELAGRVPSVLQVVKENGFTTYSTSREMENL